jgi:very-short-patch-repair endonuclease
VPYANLILRCSECGNKYRAGEKSRRYCSRECFGIAYSRNSRRNKPWGKIVQIYKSGSLSLASILKKFSLGREAALSEFERRGVPRYTQAEAQSLLRRNGVGDFPKARTRACRICSKTFLWYPSYTKSRRGYYCSRKCFAKCPKQKARQRKVAIKLLTRKKWRRTEPERQMAAVFKKHGAKVVPQFSLGPFVYDFYWPEFGYLIEVDGDFWHGHLRRYPWHKKIIQNDKRKDAYGKACGLKVIRVRESDLKNRFQELLSLK